MIAENVDELPQAKMHSFNPAAGNKRGGAQYGKVVNQAPLVEDPNQVFYTLDDVAKHATKDDCWSIYKGKVYDITAYAKIHPGGKVIYEGAGKDMTALFQAEHPWVSVNYLIGKCQVGVLKK